MNTYKKNEFLLINIFNLMNQQRERVLIIGAGPSGLSLLRAFECQRELWEGRLELVCVEKQS